VTAGDGLPAVEGVDHRWVEARGLRFHVAEAGAGADPVVLLHGWPQHWYEWRHLIPALADRHRVLAPDLRGFGWSDAPPGGYEKENLAADVLAVMDELGLGRVKLVGHDWGAWIGFLLCLRAPERFDRLLGFNIIHPWQRVGASLPHLWRFWYQWLIATPGVGYRGHRSRRLTDAALRGGVTDPGAWDEDTLAAFTTNLAEPARARACVRLYRNFVLRELPAIGLGRYRDSRLRVPTRIVFGADDRAMSHRQLAGHEGHADRFEVEVVPGCGHFIVDERPELVADRARSFLSQ
jgi:pimeloyl-ACP methyl ester carboxylesterase